MPLDDKFLLVRHLANINEGNKEKNKNHTKPTQTYLHGE